METKKAEMIKLIEECNSPYWIDVVSAYVIKTLSRVNNDETQATRGQDNEADEVELITKVIEIAKEKGLPDTRTNNLIEWTNEKEPIYYVKGVESAREYNKYYKKLRNLYCTATIKHRIREDFNHKSSHQVWFKDNDFNSDVVCVLYEDGSVFEYSDIECDMSIKQNELKEER